jgi:prepilin-type N-terminal cleavage/methylation domain-containing protein
LPRGSGAWCSFVKDVAMTRNKSLRQTAGFTVVELLIVMMILGLLVAMALSAYSAAIAHARVSRTKVIIAKLDQLIMDKYENYRSRPLPIPSRGGMDPRTAARHRLNAIRDLIRMELPDRKSDVVDDPCNYNAPTNNAAMSPPALLQAYRRKAAAAAGSAWATTGWTETSQGAECLYLILSCMRDQEKSALDFFEPSEIGDIDGDSMPEILDGWGRPIEFLRWAPGYTIQNGALTMQTTVVADAPDPFDPLRLDSTSFYLKPLIFSGGPDKEFDVFTDNVPGTDPSGTLMAAPFHHYTPGRVAPNPFAQFAAGTYAGYIMDRDGDGTQEYHDNITNHYQEAE